MSDDKRSSLIRFNRSIRVQLLVGTVIILAAVVLLATTLIARNATQTLERQFSAQVSQLASQSARTVADFIDARSATVDLWAADTLLISVVRDPGLSAVFLPGLARYLARYAEREPWIGDVLLVKEGQALFSLAGMEGWKGQDALIARLTGAPPGEMMLVDRGATRQLAIRRQTVDRGVPMDQVYVFLLLDLAVAQDRLLEDASPGQAGFAALYDPAGALITPTQGAIPAFAKITDPQTNDHSGYLIEARAVPSAPLHVVVAADRSDINAPVRRLVLFSVLFGAAAILLGLTAMIYFTGRVTAPIRQLSSDARREALARFGLPNSPAGRATAQTEYGEDEVGELAAVFALLGRTTDELTNANAQLESRNLELNDSRRLLRVNLDRLERELDSARILQLSMVPKPNALLGRQ
ncbi:MAG: hypothetical protein EP318_18650 [Rhodobacteraceae bacterium]|nr:MAG: hypothetical protein EP318_18650 [Paracoccaceae bacterium]